MRYAKKVQIKRKLGKIIQFIFSPLAKFFLKLDEIKEERAKEKRYSEKKIIKTFLKILDYYLYKSDGYFTDKVESIILIPDYNFRSLDCDEYNYNTFIHDINYKMKKDGKVLYTARYNQTDLYLKIFNEVCSLGNKLNNEEIKNICSYYSTFDGRKILDYEMYQKLKGREVYIITRKIYEENIIKWANLQNLSKH